MLCLLFFSLSGQGRQPVGGGDAQQDYARHMQQAGQVENPFHRDAPHAPAGISDGGLLEQPVPCLFVHGFSFRVVGLSFNVLFLFTVGTVYQVDNQSYGQEGKQEGEGGEQDEEKSGEA